MAEGTNRHLADGTIARLGRRQHGVVTRSQLLQAGLSQQVIGRRLRSGRLQRLYSGVYVIDGSTSSWERDALAVCLSFGETAVLSHGSAGRVWRIFSQPDGHYDVLVPHLERPSASLAGVTVHRSRSLTSADKAQYDGLPVTTIGRTLFDLAAFGMEREALARALDEAICKRIADPGRLSSTFARLSGKGRRHTAVLGGLLKPWLDGRGFDSVAEGVFWRRIVEAGLPEPVTRYEVFDAGVFVARLDLAWPDRMVALEVDGFRWHANPHSFASDAERTSRLAALGWTTLRATPAQLDTRPETVLAALRRQLGDRPPARSPIVGSRR